MKKYILFYVIFLPVTVGLAMYGMDYLFRTPEDFISYLATSAGILAGGVVFGLPFTYMVLKSKNEH
ncbi:hypothetical protein [Aquisalibacillus elongatus]|uniref:Uncharacterized protein n=1 Tax=Aquisalibacillus elongatus TaxID=485577 RepID=A0A3N5BXQ7_9BACI|nr:hypothetical protein [Aquisalibacillus elongatus]RPF50655.1 hypothetical protein EDC24_2624 [Aquisalibacillus elongatus]